MTITLSLLAGVQRERKEKQSLLETGRAWMPLVEVENWEIKDAKVILHGNTAVCNYYYSETGKLKGKAYQASGNGTDIFVNKDEKWRLVSPHATEFNKIVPAQ